MNHRKLTLLSGLLAVALGAGIAPAAARAQGAEAKAKKTLKFCIYDPSGAMGDAFNMAKDYRAAAVAWGVDLDMTPYTDERTASEDFKAGKCDLALLTGVRARHFNRFAGTVEALGALTNYDQLHSVLKLLASPKAGKKMRNGPYEVVAIFPAGAVYLLLRDRKLRSVKDLAGKRIATLDFDEAAIALVDRAGASMVPADIGTFAGMFNNGGVDVAYAPAAAVEPLELKKGLQPDGGVARYPLAQLTLQILARRDSIDEAFGNASRKFASDNFKMTLKVVEKAEKNLPKKLWIDITPEESASYDDLFRSVRLDMKKKKVFDGTMLRLMRRVRCKEDPARAECAEKRE